MSAKFAHKVSSKLQLLVLPFSQACLTRRARGLILKCVFVSFDVARKSPSSCRRMLAFLRTVTDICISSAKSSFKTGTAWFFLFSSITPRFFCLYIFPRIPAPLSSLSFRVLQRLLRVLWDKMCVVGWCGGAGTLARCNENKVKTADSWFFANSYRCLQKKR